MIIAVAVPCPLRKTFDYICEAALDQSVQPGMRVLVPFGRQKVVGIVVALKATSSLAVAQLKAATLLDTQAIIPADLLALAQWLSDYYHAPIGQVFQFVLPAYLRKGRPQVIPATDYYALTAQGQIWLEGAAHGRMPAKSVIMEYLAQQGTVCAANIKVAFPNFAQHKKWLLTEKLMAHEARVIAVPQLAHSVIKPTALPLNAHQRSAIAALTLNQKKIYALEGVTGSGKTAVYIEMAKKALNNQQQVLILVPEIGLTPQFIARIAGELPVPYVAIHSGLTEKVRYEAWAAASSHQVSLVIGTRSALFTPFKQLGLIIIDEAHDGSYRQRDGIRYSAHDSAIMRADLCAIPIVLGSATPTLETLRNIERRRFVHLLLPARAKGALPQWTIIDSAKETLYDGLTGTLLNAIEETLSRGEQVMIFLNRRGYAPLLLCEACGWVPDCIQCSSHMTVHRFKGLLNCHHCGYTAKLPVACPECGQKMLKMVGVGTQRLEKSLTDAFPRAQVLRFDRDSIRNKQDFEHHVHAIINGQANIIIGTQMLSKGHDFANVTLVALVDSDGLLYSTDFRAEEKLAQILVQVSGRSGRSDKKGRVFVQTYFPQHALFTQLPRVGYSAYAKTLLAPRQQFGFPPFSYQVLLQTEARIEVQAQTSLEMLITCVPSEGIELTPVLPNVLSRRQGYFRFYSVLQSSSRKRLHQIMHQLLYQATVQMPSSVRLICEVDPLDFG